MVLAAAGAATQPSHIVRAAESGRYAPATQPSSGESGPEAIFDLCASGRRSAALAAMSRVVRAGGPELARAEVAARLRFDRPLAEVLAEWRVGDALARAARGPFRLRGVTRYECYAVGSLLASRETEWLGAVHAGRSIEAWSHSPRDYGRLHEQAQTMVAQARLAAAMMGERLRLDPALDGDEVGRAQLAARRDRLMRLTAHVSAMPGFTSLPPPALFQPAGGTESASSQPAPTGRAGSLFDDDD